MEMQIKKIIEMYGLDGAICAVLSIIFCQIIRTYLPKLWKKSQYYAPTIGGFLISGIWCLLQKNSATPFLERCMSCAVAASLLNTAFEQFVLKKKSTELPSNRHLFTIAGILCAVLPLETAVRCAKPLLRELENVRGISARLEVCMDFFKHEERIPLTQLVNHSKLACLIVSALSLACNTLIITESQTRA